MKVKLSLLIVLSLSLHALAQEPMAKVRAHLETKDQPLVGQRITLVIDLLAPGFFSGNAAYTLPNVPGVLLIPPEGSPMIGSVQEDGISYTSQRHELYVFARRAGKHEIPSIPIRVQFKRNPLDHEAVVQTLQTPPLSFTAKQPPGAENLNSVICARGLKIEDTWNPEAGQAKAGDAFTRTITFSAPDVPAMAFPEFPAGKIDGLDIYPKAPEVLDESDRGTLLGQRRDTFTYVCTRPGRFVIPAAKLTWWDLDSNELRTKDFPSRVLQVAPNPAFSNATTDPSRIWPRLAEIAALLIAVILVGRKIPVRCLWRVISAPFRPVHLQPLNPRSPN